MRAGPDRAGPRRAEQRRAVLDDVLGRRRRRRPAWRTPGSRRPSRGRAPPGPGRRGTARPSTPARWPAGRPAQALTDRRRCCRRPSGGRTGSAGDGWCPAWRSTVPAGRTDSAARRCRRPARHRRLRPRRIPLPRSSPQQRRPPCHSRSRSPLPDRLRSCGSERHRGNVLPSRLVRRTVALPRRPTGGPAPRGPTRSPGEHTLAGHRVEAMTPVDTHFTFLSATRAPGVTRVHRRLPTAGPGGADRGGSPCGRPRCACRGSGRHWPRPAPRPPAAAPPRPGRAAARR